MSKLLLVLFAFVTLNYIGSNSKKIHNCVHDQLPRKTAHKTFVRYSYDLNSAANINSNKRRLSIPIEEYSPIRIKPYWADIEASSLSNTKKNVVKALVSSSINYFESFLRVIPVEGPLFVARECGYGYPADGPLHSYWNCADNGVVSQCGLVAIPSTHLRNEWMYNGYGAVTVNAYPAGNGLRDTDLVLYVSAEPDNCGNHTLAWARHCNVDQYGRPISGTINFCPNSLDEIDWKMDVLSILHELTHVLAFSRSLFPTFIDMFGNPLDSEDILRQVVKTNLNLNNTYLITPNVRSFAREHYGCSSLVGAPLEDDGGGGAAGSHWEEHHVNGEYMISILYNKLDYVSGLTLALLEDSGWYKVDYNYSEPYSWGKNEGCAFFNNACFDATTGHSNFPQYFCEAPYPSPLCTYDYSAKAVCYNMLSSSYVPSMFKYFSDRDEYGTVYSEHCPFADAIDDATNTDFQHVCWDERGNNFDTENSAFGNVYGLNSRCVEASVAVWGGMESFCYPLECDLNNESITIHINTGQVICNKADKYTYQSLADDGNGNQYNVSCPNYDSICVNEQPFQCLWGFWSNDLNQCVCSAGYEGDVCDVSLTDLENAEVSLYSGSFDVDGYKNTICLKLGGLNAAWNGDWEYGGVDNNVYPYYTKGVYYLYFEAWYHLWSIGTELGEEYSSESVIGVCSVGERPYDVSVCSNFFYFVDEEHDKWTQDINLVIGAYACPVSPTPSPTLCPTCTDFPESRPVNTFYTDGGDGGGGGGQTDNATSLKPRIIFPLCLLLFFAVI